MPATPIYALPYPAVGDPADVPTDMQELADRIEAIMSPELAYAEITANATVNATVEASANTIITAPAITVSGTQKIIVEFQAMGINPNGAGVIIWLFQDGASVGQIAGINQTSGNWAAISGQRRLTPAAGSRTYSIRATINAGSGTIYAGSGGSGQATPAFIRITRV